MSCMMHLPNAKPWPIASNRPNARGNRSSKANRRMSGPSDDDKCPAKVHYHLSSIRLTQHLTAVLSNARKTVSVDTATYTILGRYVWRFPPSRSATFQAPDPHQKCGHGQNEVVFSYRLIVRFTTCNYRF